MVPIACQVVPVLFWVFPLRDDLEVVFRVLWIDWILCGRRRACFVDGRKLRGGIRIRLWSRNLTHLENCFNCVIPLVASYKAYPIVACHGILLLVIKLCIPIQMAFESQAMGMVDIVLAN